jgi:hypothetical protein
LSSLIADTGVGYPPCSGTAAVDSYTVIREEKTVTRFLRAPPAGEHPADFIFPVVNAQQGLKVPKGD